MPELLTPGVYIQEVDFGPNPIEGVSTSTAGFVGEAERGPDSGAPVLVTSFAEFQRNFGGFVKGKTLAYAVRGFFENGGKRAFIARVVPSDAAAATKTLDDADGHDVRVLAASGTKLTLSSVVGLTFAANAVRLFKRSDNSADGTYTASTVNSATGVVTLTGSLASGVGPATHYARITAAPGTAVNAVKVSARDKGVAGNRISVLIEPYYVDSTKVASQSSATDLVAGDVGGLAVGAQVQLENAAQNLREVSTIVSIDPGTNAVKVGTLANTYPGGKLFLIGWRLTVLVDGAQVELIDGLSSALTSGAAADLVTAVNARSAWVRIDGTIAALSAADNIFPAFVRAQPVLLAGGLAGSTAVDPVGSDTPPRTGLKALEAQKEINIIAAPGFTSTTVVDELIGQAERKMDRFAVFESSSTTTLVTDVLNERGKYNSRYAAMYHPWITVLDPITRTEISMPPSGHVLGAYARTDNDRGVFKAPANIVLRGITGFTQDVPDGEQDLLNPAGVNVLRHFDGLGSVIWGARTISAEGLWKYVPVRRLFIMLEQSIIKGTRYAVFEPNDLRLWARLRDAITNFLTSQWRAGALFGSKPEEAFFVRVDETTTTQDDRDNGRVNVIVGIAPVKPAEFIVFQIGQAPQSVIIAEQQGT